MTPRQRGPELRRIYDADSGAGGYRGRITFGPASSGALLLKLVDIEILPGPLYIMRTLSIESGPEPARRAAGRTTDRKKDPMNRRTQQQLGSRDRIAAFAKATEAYAETLDDPDLANVYWGKSLGLWQAVTILSAEDEMTPRRQPRGASGRCGPRLFKAVRRPDVTRPGINDPAGAPQGS
jgi:hypothetical protein